MNLHVLKLNGVFCIGCIGRSDAPIALMKDNKYVTNDSIAAGWEIIGAVDLLHGWLALSLKSEHGEDGVWYFSPSNHFGGNSIETFEQGHLVLSNFANYLIRELCAYLFHKKSIGSSDFERSLSAINSKLMIDLNKAVLGGTPAHRVDVRNYNSADGKLLNLLVELAERPAMAIQDECLRFSKLTIAVEPGGEAISSNKTIVLSDFLTAIPFVCTDGRTILLFLSDHLSRPIAFYAPWESHYVYVDDTVEDARGLVANLFQHLVTYFPLLLRYFRTETKGVGAWLRNDHIGHHLWNDLTGLERIQNNGLISNLKELIIYPTKLECYGPVERFFDLENCYVNRTVFSQEDLIRHCYEKGLFWIRLTDIYIPKSLVDKIIAHSAQSELGGFGEKNQSNNLIVVFGLRFENRTWLNQATGLIDVARYLANNCSGLTIVVDGHNLATGTEVAIKSYQEHGGHGVLELEKSVVSALQHAGLGGHVSIVDGVNISVATALNLINRCDFFIAPWGAGLVKYKWLCNKPGLVFTSSRNLKFLPDLRIYESGIFREGATSCHYVDEKYIEDFHDGQQVVGVIGDDRANFIVDLDGVYQKLDLLIQSTRENQ